MCQTTPHDPGVEAPLADWLTGCPKSGMSEKQKDWTNK